MVGMVWGGAPQVSIRKNEILKMPFALSNGIDYAPGIMVFRSPNTIFLIKENTINNTHIGVWISGRSEISNNTIKTYGNCLLCWDGGDYSNIHDNNLTKTSVPPEAGTWIWEDDAVFLMDGSHYSVRSNSIVMEDPSAISAIRFGLYFAELAANNNLFQGNKITGTAMLGSQLDWNSSDNVFLGNNLSGLDCSATYYLGPSTYDNIVKGYTAECNVIDETDKPETPEYDGLNYIAGCER
jgi:hypothetical protein